MRRGTSRRSGAFVLVEMLVVAAVIAVLLGLGYSVYRGARKSARIALAENNLKQIGTGLELYFQKYGSYPPYGSQLSEVLLPFVQNEEVFTNPLVPEGTPGETVDSLYFPPTISEGDSGTHYVTAFVSDDGQTAVVLYTGGKVEAGEYPTFEPTQTTSVIHAITGETVIAGIINIDPRNNTDFQFTMGLTGGGIINRSMLLGSDASLTFSGAVEWIQTWPKGDGNQNGLEVNGVTYPLLNGRLYTISRLDGRMRAHLYNELPVLPKTKKKVNTSEDMGEWYVDVLAIGGQITESK